MNIITTTFFEKTHNTKCLVCGKDIIYEKKDRLQVCLICGVAKSSNASCINDHFICDHCHTSGFSDWIETLHHSSEKDPILLFESIAKLKSVNMHGPEHHSIVPAILLTAYRNCGGDLCLEDCLALALQRGRQVPGGICGFWGACGAAIGAGIYASILLDSNPLESENWSIPQSLTSNALARMAEIGGPRCCKRTTRLALETAVEFTEKHLNIVIPTSYESCTFHELNTECLYSRCPYYNHGELL